MAYSIENKVKYLREKNYPEELIKLVVDCGVKKYLVWIVERVHKEFKEEIYLGDEVEKTKKAIIAVDFYLKHLEKHKRKQPKTFKGIFEKAILFHQEDILNKIKKDTKSSDSDLELVELISLIKKDFNTKVDELLIRVKEFDGRFLFLSNKMKQKIFGNQYLLKGNNYTISDLIRTNVGEQEPRARGDRVRNFIVKRSKS
jgi:hypothetical protein